MLRRILLVTPVYAALFGLFLSVQYRADSREENRIVLAEARADAASRVNRAKSEAFIDNPTSIHFARFDKTVAIEPGYYDVPSQTWTLNDDTAHFAARTQPLSTTPWGGQTLIYGHNTDPLFAEVNKLRDGDVVEVTGENGHRFFYAVRGQDVVNPDETSVFDYPAEARTRLVLMACTGVWNEQRRIVYLEPIAAEAANNTSVGAN